MLNYQCYIKPHGKFQAEFKLRYPVTNKKHRYGLDLYFFSPQVLSVDRKSYGITAFLKDLRIMTRISTPDIPLPRLTDEDFTVSPINRIKKKLELTTGVENRDRVIMYELRTLSSILRVQMSKNRSFLKKKIDRHEDIELLSGWMIEAVKNIEVFLESFRELKKLFVRPDINDKLNLAYDWTDESISLNIQRESGNMERLCHNVPELSGCTKMLVELITGEIKHRKARGYLTGIESPDKHNIGELLIYRESILKKWSQSAMYLNVTKSRTPARIAQIIAGTAAAAAMTFAVIATILTNHFFPANTTAWALAAVIAYIFKDRIKETLRSGLKIMFPRLIPDQMVILRDPSGKGRSGFTKTFVEFTLADNIPSEILEKRGWDRKPFKEMLPTENVIVCRHEVALDGRKFFRNHERMESVTEIIRLELHKFLQLMDDPDQIYYFSQDGELKKKRLRRVYHLNLVTVLTDLTGDSRDVRNYRVILNRDGIERIERGDV